MSKSLLIHLIGSANQLYDTDGLIITFASLFEFVSNFKIFILCDRLEQQTDRRARKWRARIHAG